MPNPERKKLDAEIRQARAHLEQLQAHYGLAALENPERRRPTMRRWKGATRFSGLFWGFPLDRLMH